MHEGEKGGGKKRSLRASIASWKWDEGGMEALWFLSTCLGVSLWFLKPNFMNEMWFFFPLSLSLPRSPLFSPLLSFFPFLIGPLPPSLWFPLSILSPTRSSLFISPPDPSLVSTFRPDACCFYCCYSCDGGLYFCCMSEGAVRTRSPVPFIKTYNIISGCVNESEQHGRNGDRTAATIKKRQ